MLDDAYDADDEENMLSFARFIILEPFIMIPSTTITNSFPCVRRAIFSDQYRSTVGEFSYALVIGNIVHEAFERIL